MRSLFARLLNQQGSIVAALRAGRKTTISARVYRATTGCWEELGPIASHEESWGAFLHRQWPAGIIIRWCAGGKEIDRTRLQ